MFFLVLFQILTYEADCGVLSDIWDKCEGLGGKLGREGLKLNELESSLRGEVSVGWKQSLTHSVWPEILQAGLTFKWFLALREAWTFGPPPLFLFKPFLSHSSPSGLSSSSYPQPPLCTHSPYSFLDFIPFFPSFLPSPSLLLVFELGWTRGMMVTGTWMRGRKKDEIEEKGRIGSRRLDNHKGVQTLENVWTQM